MFRKILVFVLTVAIISSFYITAFATPVSVDGVVYELEAISVDGSLLVPFRDIFGILGAEVSWDPVSRTGTAEIGDYRVVAAVGECFLIANGERRDMAVATQIVDDMIYVPVRASAEAFRSEVTYDSLTGTVIIMKNELPWSLGDIFRGIILAKGWEGIHIALQVGDSVNIDGVDCASITAYSDSGAVGSFAVSYDFMYVYEVTADGNFPLYLTR